MSILIAEPGKICDNIDSDKSREQKAGNKMNFQIDSEEFEVQEETKKHSIQFEVQDTVKRVAFLTDRYQQRLKAVERRRKNLYQNMGVSACCTIGLFLIAGIMALIVSNSAEGMVFAMWAIGLFIIVGIGLFVRTLRIIWSYGVHMGKHSGGGTYTLCMEEQDLHQLLKQLEETEEQLEDFLAQEQMDEETARQVLKEIEARLVEKEQRADYLYGEMLKG